MPSYGGADSEFVVNIALRQVGTLQGWHTSMDMELSDSPALGSLEGTTLPQVFVFPSLTPAMAPTQPRQAHTRRPAVCPGPFTLVVRTTYGNIYDISGNGEPGILCTYIIQTRAFLQTLLVRDKQDRERKRKKKKKRCDRIGQAGTSSLVPVCLSPSPVDNFHYSG